MMRRLSEFEKASRQIGESASFRIVRPSAGESPPYAGGNVLLSGQSPLKAGFLLQIIAQNAAAPMIVVTDSQRSSLSAELTGDHRFSFVRSAGESSAYNFLLRKSVPESMPFFIHAASQDGLFDQNRANAELLLRTVLRLAAYGSGVFTAAAGGLLTGDYLQTEIARQRRITPEEKTQLISSVQSSISAASAVTAAFYDLFAMMADMRGIPFSLEDVIERRRHVCFCLDGGMDARSRCWYLGQALKFDLACLMNRPHSGLVLVLDLSSREKLELFSNFIGVREVKTILSVQHTEYLTGSWAVSQFDDLFVFSHPDIASARYWSEFFASRKVAEYTYTSSQNRTNRYPLLPMNLGMLFGEANNGSSSSVRLVDKPVFQINDIRELENWEYIHYNNEQKFPIRCSMR